MKGKGWEEKERQAKEVEFKVKARNRKKRKKKKKEMKGDTKDVNRREGDQSDSMCVILVRRLPAG